MITSLELIAWTGNAAEFPANTIPAVHSALQLGAEAVALEMQLSADAVAMATGLPHVEHAGKREVPVHSLAASELCAIEAADRSRFGDRHTGTCIATLAGCAMELLEGRAPRARLLVHLSPASIAQFGVDPVLESVLVAVAPLEERCTVVCDNLQVADRARARGAASIGWLPRSFDTHTQIKCEAVCPDYLFVDDALLQDVARLWRGPWRWAALGITAANRLDDLAARGVHSVCTPLVRGMHRELMMWRARLAAARESARPG